MKILLIHNYYQTYGGEDKGVSQECQLLEENGHDVYQYVRHNDEIKHYNLLKRILFLCGIFFNIKTVLDLRKALKTFSPDVAHIHNVFPLISPSAYVYLKLRKIPIIQAIHNFRFICSNGLFFIDGKICERCFKFNFTPLFKRCFHNNLILSLLYSMTVFFYRFTGIYNACISKFICQAEFPRIKMVQAGYAEDKMVIKPNFLLESEISSTETNIDKINKKDKYCLYFGRLSEEKGIKTLLDAFRNITSFKLKIAGSGPLVSLVKSRLSSIIEYVGFVQGDEKNALIEGAQFVVFPTEVYENFSRPVLEANGLKTMVLASSLVSLHGLIKENETGLFFMSGDINDLRNKVEFLSLHPEECQRMGKNGRNFAGSYAFSKEKNYKTLMLIYESALQSK